METHQKDIEENDPFGQNRNEADEADEAEADEADDEKSFLKALQLRWERLKNIFIMSYRVFTQKLELTTCC